MRFSSVARRLSRKEEQVSMRRNMMSAPMVLGLKGKNNKTTCSPAFSRSRESELVRRGHLRWPIPGCSISSGTRGDILNQL